MGTRDGRILVVEDDPAWVDMLQLWFRQYGYTHSQFVDTGVKALETAIARPPDCIVLDLGLPDMTGMDVCQGVRAVPALARTPIILFTSHPRDKVQGLQNGADYFVAKVEQPQEFLATLEAALRKRQSEEGVMVRGDIALRPQSRKVERDGRDIATLSPKMFRLLYALVERWPEPVGRDELYRLVAGNEDPGLSRALDVMLNRLRKTLPADLAARIVSVKNYGYAFLDAKKSK